ncbi:RpiB/LacA/LacB family sugar-phosphate isomerase [Candidatus Bathyarchaeota archaeon]|nr:MAG: RpiB/LacA/LacB family sugar-phosphate isomerase [Candidatus Bathyarchaeota archaeon]
MKLALGSDEKTGLIDFVLEEPRKRGHNVSAYGPMAGEQMGWPDVGEKIGLEVSSGRADQGIAFCWTGTGVCIAANKVPGVRAALCWDAGLSWRGCFSRLVFVADPEPFVLLSQLRPQEHCIPGIPAK